MFHSVYFWLKRDLPAADRKVFEEELRLLTRISYLKQARIGKPAKVDPRPVCDLSFDWNLIVEFATDADHDFYQNECKDHQRFINTCKTMWEKVIVYDMTPEA
ncbi:MAG: Dabb family protein [Verrucomicrobiaceae bacterium]|nr:Dabb family protein [Verrucomicrobiaceae bacterium]